MTHTQESDELVGRVLIDQYQVISRLGSGGYGQVYKVLHLGMSRAAAAKVCSADATSPVLRDSNAKVKYCAD